MAQILKWDALNERVYETGVDKGVLYIPDETGAYNDGVAWMGLTNVTESPTGAEPAPMYADNIKYLNLVGREDFEGTIEAFTYPDEFAQFDGLAEPEPGVLIGQQTRGTFGFAYRSLLGDPLLGTDRGYKLHLIYGALASPTERSHDTVNETPETITFSWELTTTPVGVTGYKPTSSITIDSTQVTPADLTALELILYGDDTPTTGAPPRLPFPDEIMTLMAAA